MTLSQRTGFEEINTQWSFRFPLLVRNPIRKDSFPKQSGTGMPSLIHSSLLLNCRTIAYLNSLPLLELGANLPRPNPGEVLSFLAFHQYTNLILILIPINVFLCKKLEALVRSLLHIRDAFYEIIYRTVFNKYKIFRL